ncbi:hypothetical protein DFH09DRAFT_1459655 [Mycena vulgaris]|nr:hypothetical protein DFH09DRAFT_1459655 [Mycena vulgaris]
MANSLFDAVERGPRVGLFCQDYGIFILQPSNTATVFKDMVAFPLPASEGAELIDGSRVAILRDSAADMEVLLGAIFDSSPEPISIDALLGILRLSHKYDIQYLHRRSLQHLSAQYFAGSVDEYLSLPQGHFLVPGDFTFSLLSVIQAVTEVGALWLLPIMYYTATVGTSSTRDKLLATIELGAAAAIVHRCMLSYTDLVLGGAVAFSFVCTYNGTGGQGPFDHSCGRNSLYLATAGDKLELFPLSLWTEGSWDLLPKAMCGPCLDAMRERDRESCKAFWDRLPSIYGLPAWPELHAMRGAALGDDT